MIQDENSGAQQAPQDSATEAGAIAYPEGISAEWLVRKTKHIKDEFDKWFAKELSNIQEKYKMYEVKDVNGVLPGGTSIPIVTSVVDTANARLTMSLVPREKFVDAVAKDPDTMQGEGIQERREKVEHYVNETIKTTPYFEEKMDELFKTLLIEDVVPAQVYWSEEEYTATQVIRDVDPNTGMPVIVGEEETTSKFGRPDILPLSIRGLIWEPRCKTRFSDSPYVGKITMVSTNELLRMEQEGIIQDVQKILDRAPKQVTQDTKNDPDAQQSQAVEGQNLPSVGWDDGVYQLIEWWATLAWKTPDGKYQVGEYEFWIVGGDVVVKFRENHLKPKRKPFVTVKAAKKPGMILSQGPVDSIKGLYKDIITNMARKNSLIANAANSPTFYEPSSGLDGRRVSLQTNSMIPVLNVNGIKRVEPPVNAIQLIDNTITFLIGQSREATASNEQAQGIGGDADTATESQILAQGANSRFQYMADMIAASLFGDYAQEIFLFSKQFGVPGQMVVRQGGVDGEVQEILPEDLAGNYCFKAVPAQTQVGKERRFAMLTGFLEKLATAPPGTFKDSNGQVMEPQVFEFLSKTMMPLMDISAANLFKPAQMQPGMMQQAPVSMDGSAMPLVDPMSQQPEPAVADIAAPSNPMGPA
jgi:hypothetical protein